MFRKPLVSVDWLFHHLEDENLIILDATISKITDKAVVSILKEQIVGAIFFDIKKTFSDTNSPFPNTILSVKEFEIEARNLGINNNSKLVIYDDLGIYASPRVWWMFQLMGFKNTTVLDGGLPAWKAKGYSTEKQKKKPFSKGNFTANYQSRKIKFTKDILTAIDDSSILVADARSQKRFSGSVLEPRKEVRNGHIPNAISIPYTELLQQGIMKSEAALATLFENKNPTKKELIFSCGTGITACTLALGAELCGIENYAVYDGSWTEWGSTLHLPVSVKKDGVH
jgi:thiosulfate/3-mercaptopyruvate sulfurtransferase